MFAQIVAFLHQVFRNVCELEPKKLSKTLKRRFIFGLRMVSRSVTHHSTTGSEALLLYTQFLMLPQYNDDDGGAINSLFSPSFALSIPLIHSLVCPINRLFILLCFHCVRERVCIGQTDKQHNMYSIKYF